MKPLLLILLSLITVEVFAMGTKEITFRPIDLTVIDEQTKEPLKGVTVKVLNSIAYYKGRYFLWFHIDGEQREKCFLEEFITDEKGTVQIPEYKYNVRNKYYLRSQSVFINIETLDESKRGIAATYKAMDYLFYEKEGSYFKRPIDKYRAYLLICLPHQVNDDYWKQIESTKPYITEIFKGYDVSLKSIEEGPISFNCGIEEFVIPLQLFF